MGSTLARLLALVVLVALIAAVPLYLRTGGSEDDPGHVPDTPPAVADGPAVEPAAEPSPEEAPSEPVALAPSEAPAPERTAVLHEVPDDVAEGRCVLTGLVRGPDGAPLEGVLCRVGAKKRWRKGSEPVEFDAFGIAGVPNWVGYESTTDANGRFLLDVPVPTARWVELFVDGGRFLSVVSLEFGKGRGRLEPLAEGLREVDDLSLTECGAVSGVVVTASGEPVEEARVNLAPASGETRRLDADADGLFDRAHLAPGTWSVHATAPGMLDSLPVEAEIVAGADLTDVRLEVALAPVVTGRVVTPDQSPVEDAVVTANVAPGARGNKSARTKTDGDGAFELVLPSLGEFDVSCAHPEHRPASSPLRLSGAQEGVTLVLKPLARVHVTAVDAETGEPLERFGVLKVADGGSKAANPEYARRAKPRIKKVRSGYEEVFGRAGRDLLIVAADGYSDCFADLAGATWVDGYTRPEVSPALSKAPGAEAIVQTIEMSRGGSVQGRLLAGGAPVSAEVSLRRAPDADNLFVQIRGRQRRVTVESDADTGGFAFEGLTAGTYRLYSAAEGGSVSVASVEVEMGETTDLGDLELAASGAIVGTVLLPVEVDPKGLTIEVADVVGIEPARLQEDLSFRIEGVPAGLRTIRQGALRQDFMMGGDTEVNVPAGGEVQVTLDLTTYRIVPVSLQIELDGEPVPGIEVRLVDEDFWPDRRIPDFTEEVEAYVGRTDAEGRLSAYGRATGRRIPVLHIDTWSVIAHPTARLDFGLGQPIDERVAFETASATVVLPDDVALPEDGSLRIAFVSREDERIRSSITIGFDGGDVDEAFGAQHDASARSWTLDRIAPGDWRIVATLFGERIAPSRIGDPDDAVFGASSDDRRVFEGEVTLEGGGRTRVELSPR
ncbi:MAG: carboxypeptidase regulatory-like domain-containing protein [Planctomycetota bacterium]